jgi:hypothetical protein
LPGHSGPATFDDLSTGNWEHDVANNPKAPASTAIIQSALKEWFPVGGTGGGSNMLIINKSLELEATLNSQQEWIE